MLCTVLSCHIGHGMTRTNQKCNSHLQSMSHVTWIKLNAFIFEALRIKTECVAVRFHVQLLHMHKSGQCASRTRQAVGFCTEKCVMLVRKPRNHSCFVCNFAFVLHGFFPSGVSMFATYFLCSSMFICGAEGRCSTKVFCIPNLV